MGEKLAALQPCDCLIADCHPPSRTQAATPCAGDPACPEVPEGQGAPREHVPVSTSPDAVRTSPSMQSDALRGAPLCAGDLRSACPEAPREDAGGESDARREDAVGEPGVGGAAAVRDEKEGEPEPDAQRDASEEVGTLDPKPSPPNQEPSTLIPKPSSPNPHP